MTESLVELGLLDHLFGRTGFCVRPDPQVRQVQKMGGTKSVLLDQLRAATPTHLIVNPEENSKDLIEFLSRWQLEDPDHFPAVITTFPRTVSQSYDVLQLLWGIFGSCSSDAAAMERFAGKYRALLDDQTPDIRLPDDELKETSLEGPARVLVLVWSEPWIAVSAHTYIADLLTYGSMQVTCPFPVLSQSAPLSSPGIASREQSENDRVTPYPHFHWDTVDWSAVDAILLPSEPYRFDETHLSELSQKIEVAMLAQSPNKPKRLPSVCLVDGRALTWHGVSTIDGLAEVKRLRSMLFYS